MASTTAVRRIARSRSNGAQVVHCIRAECRYNLLQVNASALARITRSYILPPCRRGCDDTAGIYARQRTSENYSAREHVAWRRCRADARHDNRMATMDRMLESLGRRHNEHAVRARHTRIMPAQSVASQRIATAPICAVLHDDPVDFSQRDGDPCTEARSQ